MQGQRKRGVGLWVERAQSSEILGLGLAREVGGGVALFAKPSSTVLCVCVWTCGMTHVIFICSCWMLDDGPV